MGSPFFIQSVLGDLVIDVEGASTKPGTLLDAWPRKTSGPGWDNQLWTFVASDEAGFYFLQNPASELVVDVQGNSTAPGTPLDAWPLKKLGNPGQLISNAPNQLWTFAPASKYVREGSNWQSRYFIQSALGDGNLVIDVRGASTSPGTTLDAWPRKTPEQGWDNQLWTFVDEDGNEVTPPPQFTPLPPPP